MISPLETIRKKRSEALDRLYSKRSFAEKYVHVGMATCEIAAGSKEVMEVFSQAVQSGTKGVHVSQKGCAGRCNLEPTVEVIENNKPPVQYCRVTPEMAKQIVKRHLKNNEIIEE